MIKRLLIYLVMVSLILIFLPLIRQFRQASELNNLASAYVDGTIRDLNIPNVVTSVVVTYRGLDTLGEVTVLFIATAGVAFFMKRKTKGEQEVKRNASELLITGTAYLLPIIILFGIYIFVHGHLTPGGGFQGGVAVASAFLLLMMAEPVADLNSKIIIWVESLSGFFYVIIGVLGLILTGSFLYPGFLSLGKYGTLFSGGAIPVIYSLIGLKVGSELTNILEHLEKGGTMIITLILGFILILIGIWGMLINRNLFKIVIGFSILDTGTHIVIVSVGYLKNRTAPIIDEAVGIADASAKVIDPIPSALVLTAIVIGLAVTALMLTYIVRMHKHKGSLCIEDYLEPEKEINTLNPGCGDQLSHEKEKEAYQYTEHKAEVKL